MGPSGMFGQPPSSQAPVAPPSQIQAPLPKGHASLSFTVLPVRTRQATLYSTSSSIPKIFLKLIQLVQAADPSLITAENRPILQELQNGLEKQPGTPNFRIPAGTFKLIGKSFGFSSRCIAYAALESIYGVLPPVSRFPLMDILRLLVLHPTAADYYSGLGK